MSAAILFVLTLLYVSPSQSAPRHVPQSFEQIAKQADEARTANRLNDAIALYSRGVGLRSSWSEGWWWLASLLYDQDRFPEAQQAYAHFVKLDAHPGPGYAFLALCEYENHDYDRALEHFRAWSKAGSPGNNALLDVAGYHWALLLTRKGQFSQALYLLTAKVKKVGASPELIEAMGLASLRKTWLPSEYPSAQRELVWLAGEAAVYSARDDNARTDEYARRLEARYPQEPNVHFFVGTLLSFQNKFAQAADEYKKELQLSPDHVLALTELAMAEIRNFEAPSALPFAEKAVKLDPNNARALYAYGKALLDTEHFQECIPQLEAARIRAPNSSLIRSALATAYRHEGRLQDAKREASAFLALQGKEESLTPFEEVPPRPQKIEIRP